MEGCNISLVFIFSQLCKYSLLSLVLYRALNLDWYLSSVGINSPT